MGGRGAKYGISIDGKKYGSEYTSVAQFGKIKVVRRNDWNTTAPLETRTRGRVYATLDKKDDIKFISFYDEENERYKTIDVKGPKHGDLLPHKHFGYEHGEAGYELSSKENKLVERTISLWENRKKKNSK